eukprot:5074544-Pyramimonas_sp.AAC.1
MRTRVKRVVFTVQFSHSGWPLGAARLGAARADGQWGSRMCVATRPFHFYARMQGTIGCRPLVFELNTAIPQ